uniref:Saccharopine dehydrogenase-like oxidoreductase n=1 Tax=Gadus morhua TaxID=8049 RepID=A0A8C5BE28_GADMO
MASSVTSKRPYHIIVFGASGFTGQYVVEEVARCATEGIDGPLKWAVAGRSRARLEKVLEQAANTLCTIRRSRTFTELSRSRSLSLPLSLQYRFYGEPVVKACIENGAHCIDICGEPQFLERMQCEYHSQALERGIYVIGSCGFDSIPADLGVLYTERQLKGTLTAVESFLTISSGPQGGGGHDATWQSAVYGFADSGALRKLRRKMGFKPLPVLGPKLKTRGSVFFSKEIDQYSIPFMGADPSVVKRTQRFLLEAEQKLPVQYSAYVGVGNLFSVAKLACGGLLFWLMVKFSLGRKLLTTFPSFFSFGMFTKEGPSLKQMEDTSFCMTFFGEGYSDGKDPALGPPDAKICTQVIGAEPGYVATPATMVQAAVTVLNDLHSLPNRGGVYTPAAAFSNTRLIERLNNHGIKFSVRSYP